MPSHSLDTPLLDAVGETLAKGLRRAFHMTTVGDLLAHYPRRYANHGELTPIADLPLGELVTIVAEVRSASTRSMRGRRGELVEVIIGDGQGTMSLTFFGQAWRLKDLRAGRQGIFSGKVGEYRGQKQLTHPITSSSTMRARPD